MIVVAAAVVSLGVKPLISIEELVLRTARNVGTKDFGLPRLPIGVEVDQLPIEVVMDDWPDMQKFLIKKGVDPKFWGWIFPLSAQQIIVNLNGAFDPTVAAQILMEAAVPMSHIDPRLVFV